MYYVLHMQFIHVQLQSTASEHQHLEVHIDNGNLELQNLATFYTVFSKYTQPSRATKARYKT